MKKAIMSVLTVWILVNAGLFGLILFNPEINMQVSATTIIVDDDGTPGVDCNYTTIQEGIDAANPGDTVFVKNGTYMEQIYLSKSINLIGENKNSTIVSSNQLWAVVTITASGVNISGFTISGGYNGIGVKSNGNNIIDNIISSNRNIGIDVDYTIGQTIKDNIMIKDGILIDGNILEHFNTHDIDTSNSVNGKPVYYWKDQIGGIIPQNAGQVILANCQNIEILSQELSNGSAGIQIVYSSNISSRGNNIDNNTYGIILFSSYNNNISKNNVSSNDQAGILLYESLNNWIIFNNIIKNAEGITLYDSTGNNIIGNNVSFSYSVEGILLIGSDENKIIGNKVFKNDLGLDITVSDGNFVQGNQIFSNRDYGIYIHGSDDNNFTLNNIYSNENVGISLSSSSLNNLLFHNNIIKNAKQARDYTNNGNKWDNGYPSGGNSWSDYSGIDNFSGLGQNISGSDGIGDTPYVIDSDSKDNYPLMALIGDFIFLYEGWNLISIPFILSDTNLNVVLNSIKGSYYAVQCYNVSDASDPWKHNQISKPSQLNDFTDIDHTIGFWIHITEPGGVLFEYFGTQPTSNQSIPLHPGWNMVGYPSLTNRNRTAALNNLTFGVEVDAVWTFNAATQTWEEIKAGDYFKVGRGYWVHATQECVWEVRV